MQLDNNKYAHEERLKRLEYEEAEKIRNHKLEMANQEREEKRQERESACAEKLRIEQERSEQEKAKAEQEKEKTAQEHAKLQQERIKLKQIEILANVDIQNTTLIKDVLHTKPQSNEDIKGDEK